MNGHIGPLTIEREREFRARGVHLHAFYRGEDVTQRCTFADDTPGQEVAHLFKLDAHGRKYLDAETNSVAREIVRGEIEIRAGDPL